MPFAASVPVHFCKKYFKIDCNVKSYNYMTNCVFTTNEGKKKLNKCYRSKSNVKVKDKSLIWNTDLVETLEFDNLLSQSIVAITSALNREESRGAHSRQDFPNRDDKKWMKHSLVKLNSKGVTNISYKPVKLKTLTNEVKTFPPKKRVY